MTVAAMIDRAFCQTMARYNRWQNANLIAAADGLDEAARQQERGAFFGTIEATLSHLLWGDTMWMSRFDGWEKPGVGIPDSPRFVAGWDAIKAARADADARILDWAGRVDAGWLRGDLTWFSGALGREVSKPVALCVVHFFNHQTHHRGQIHAMLTAAGARPGDTDLFVLPDAV